MSLLNTDYFVIQRPTDSNKHYKLSGEKLKEFIAAGETVNYKGTRDFRNSSQDPSLDGTVLNGDLYINNNPVAGDGTWAANIQGQTVDQGDRAIWNSNSNRWDLIKSDSGYHGVEQIIGTQPITVDENVPESPQVAVYRAITTDANLTAPRATRSGVVSAIAVASDVAAADGVTSPNPDAAVPASLLKATNDNVVVIEGDITDIKQDIVDIQGDITTINQDITNINTEIGDINTNIENITNGGTLSALQAVDPLEVTTELVDDTAVEGDPNFGKTETTVSIKDSSTIQKGAVQLQEVGSAVSTSNTVAATPVYVDSYYLVKDFSTFEDF